MPTVAIPPPYRGPTRGLGEIEVSGGTVLDCLAAVEARYQGFLPQVLDEAGKPHKFVRLFVNAELLDALPGEIPVQPEDRIEVLAAIAGG